MELLLTSDNKDGLQKGVMDGGACLEAVRWEGGKQYPGLTLYSSPNGLGHQWSFPDV